MNNRYRITFLFLISGLIWYAAFYLYFILSGAQNVLSNPANQSGKFLKVFMELEPLPRMFNDSTLIYKGFYLIGILSLSSFLFLNSKLNGGWVKKGFIFATLQWALMVPWFEFYLPYNVMHEPLTLVLFEAFLWYATILSVSLIESFVLNYNVKDKI